MLERVAAVIEANGSHIRYWNNFLNCFWNKGDIETMGGKSDNQISNAQYLWVPYLTILLKCQIISFSLYILNIYLSVNVQQLLLGCFMRREMRSEAICNKCHMMHYLIGLLYLWRSVNHGCLGSCGSPFPTSVVMSLLSLSSRSKMLSFLFALGCIDWVVVEPLLNERYHSLNWVTQIRHHRIERG